LENEGVISGTGIAAPITEQLPPEPAPGAEEQKPTPLEGEDSPEPAAETTEQQEERKQSKFQRRLDRQKSARVAAETETRLLREQLAKLEAQPKPSQEVGPQRDQFENLEDYLKAVSKHEAAQLIDGRLKTEREERAKQESSSRANASEERVEKDWVERETVFLASTNDYGKVVAAFVDEMKAADSEVALSDGARRCILESDVGPQLLYHLAKNPDEAERIADLSPVRQVAELGKLEAKMAPTTRKSSNAPAPIKPVSSGRSTSPGLSDNDSQSEYEAKRKSQGARWAR
jgi:hypothetical protein